MAHNHRMTPFLFACLIWAVVFACLCGAVASSKGLAPGGWFVLGALLGLIGFILVLVAKPSVPPPSPPGWYPDPWGQFQWRWYDGYQWTWQSSESVAQ